MGQQCPKWPMFRFSSFYIVFKCSKNSRAMLELWRTLEVSDWGFCSWSWWGVVYNVTNYLWSEIQHSTLNKKMQRTPISSKSWSGVVEDSGGFWLGFWFLILMVTNCPIPHNSVDTSISPNRPQMAELLTMDHVTENMTDKHTYIHCYFVYIDIWAELPGPKLS